MCTKNYILLNRNLLINDLWNSEPFTRGQAWVDLLLNTNWKDNPAFIKGVQIPVKRGQCCRSVKQLAIRWKWSEGKVKRYLDLLVSLDQITYETCGKNGAVNGAQKTGLTTLITITNYNTYQINGAVNEAQTERKQSADEAQTETYKKDNKVEDVKELLLLPKCDVLTAAFNRKRDYITQKFPHVDPDFELQKLLDKYGGKPILDPSVLVNNWIELLPKEPRNGRQGTTGSTKGTGSKAGSFGSGIDGSPKPAGYFAGDLKDRSDEW